MHLYPADKPLLGTIPIPPDKSITHRALLLGAMSEGTTTLYNPLLAGDTLATIAALKQCGIAIRQTEQSIVLEGRAPAAWDIPATALNLQQAGTGVRLLAGVLAGYPGEVVLTGEDSLLKRPMSRIAEPLRQMGVRAVLQAGCLPMTLHGRSSLQGVTYDSPVASAQVKSCLMLAGLQAQGETRVTTPLPTRDHTENLMPLFGGKVSVDGCTTSIVGPQNLRGAEVHVPGDFSAAAFWLTAAVLVPGSDLMLREIGLSPTRTGLLTLLQRMGADISVTNKQRVSGEWVGDIHACASTLTAINVTPQDVALAIDEMPLFFIAAACAEGETTIRGAGELKVKESNRLHYGLAGLRALGGEAWETEDGARIMGGSLQGGRVDCQDDHRLAMAFAIASLVVQGPVELISYQNVDTSYPGFWQHLQKFYDYL